MLEEVWIDYKEKKNRALPSDETFGKNVTASLRAMTDLRKKEILKVKVKELIFEAHFGPMHTPVPRDPLLQVQYSE